MTIAGKDEILCDYGEFFDYDENEVNKFLTDAKIFHSKLKITMKEFEEYLFTQEKWIKYIKDTALFFESIEKEEAFQEKKILVEEKKKIDPEKELKKIEEKRLRESRISMIVFLREKEEAERLSKIKKLSSKRGSECFC